jgi:magnesium chelatase subunit I
MIRLILFPRFAKDTIAARGSNTYLLDLHRSDRFFRKLATPDVFSSRLIGDIDPIKAANLKLSC